MRNNFLLFLLFAVGLWAVLLLCGCDAAQLVIFNQRQANDDADVTPTGLVVIDDSAAEWASMPMY